MPVLMKTLYIFKYTYTRVLKYLYSFKAWFIAYCSCCFGLHWWCGSLNPYMIWVQLLQLLNLTPGMIILMQLHWCRSS